MLSLLFDRSVVGAMIVSLGGVAMIAQPSFLFGGRGINKLGLGLAVMQVFLPFFFVLFSPSSSFLSCFCLSSSSLAYRGAGDQYAWLGPGRHAGIPLLPHLSFLVSLLLLVLPPFAFSFLYVGLSIMQELGTCGTRQVFLISSSSHNGLFYQ